MPGRDGELDLLALARKRSSLDPGGPRCAVVMRLLFRRLERLFADDLSQLLRLDDGCFAREMEVDLRPHVLLDVNGYANSAIRRRRRHERRILEILGADPERDLASDVGA